MCEFRAICIKIKCKECGNEQATLIPLVISNDDWIKTLEKYGEMIFESL